MRTLPAASNNPEDTQRIPRVSLGTTLPLFGAPTPVPASPIAAVPGPAAQLNPPPGAPAGVPFLRTLRLEPSKASSRDEEPVQSGAYAAPHDYGVPPPPYALPALPALPAPSVDLRQVIGVDKPRRRRLVWLFVLVPVLVLLAAGLWVLSLPAPPATFVTAPARRAPVRASVVATGVLEAVTAVDVGSEVSGRVLELLVDENDAVEPGQVLAVIDRAPLEAELEQATAHVAGADARVLQARASANEAGVLAKRTLSLREAGVSPQTELDRASSSRIRAQAELAAAQAEAASARATLKLMQAKLERATIRSPIQGIVLSRNVELGQTITAGFQTPVLFRLAKDLTQLRLRALVDEADVARIHVGNEASFSVEAYKERSFPSRVLTLANDSRTIQNVVTYRATLAVDNSAQQLRPGMTCTATIVTETKENALVVPNAALRFEPESEPDAKLPPRSAANGRSPQVWVLRGGVPQAVPVKTGVSDGEVTEIVEGLVEQTEVIIDRDEAR